jgi:hypothetical protein
MKNGQTALTRAALFENEEVEQLLRLHGAVE